MRKDKAIKFYKLAKFMANEFSKNDSTKVGAAILRPDTLEILSMGYNGMPRGINENIESRWKRPTKYSYVEHAERNAIYNAARSGVPLKDSICVTTLFPCTDCTRGLIQSGIKVLVTPDPILTSSDEIIERWKEQWDLSTEMLNEANVEIIMLDEK